MSHTMIHVVGKGLIHVGSFTTSPLKIDCKNRQTCRENLAQIRRSQPESGLSFQWKSLKPFKFSISKMAPPPDFFWSLVGGNLLGQDGGNDRGWERSLGTGSLVTASKRHWQSQGMRTRRSQYSPLRDALGIAATGVPRS